ncbi:competence protein ComEC [Acetoanaerobium pronyense]|uniref:Competence protein ComEC n=1 Tax=Acetoanaerobium pronyense TaxID=1482736 RepID=A0ABS4KEW5_9FIRM|nr:ComEC/Rec2 family competence protein [Acetoanaerobium pronyense]MBP2026308.1 competence protein ComEC [Acetoanaerobium pronyense]
MRRYSLCIFIFIFIFSLFFIEAQNYLLKSKVDIDEYNGLNTVKKIEYKETHTNIFFQDSVMTIWNDTHNIKEGDILDVRGRKQLAQNLENKGYGRYLMSKGYIYIIKPEDYIFVGRSISPLYYIQKLRDRLGRRIENIFRGRSPFIKALIYGERSEIDLSTSDTMSKTGTSHLIAISGFHIGIIAGLLGILLNKTNFLTRYIFIFFFIWIYVVFTGGRPSSVRAGAFYTFLILSVIFSEEYDILSSGFIIASALLLINPYIIYDIGFQLSFMAILSIGLFYNPIKNKAEKIKNPILKKIAKLGGLTISAQLLTLPLTYYHFGRISLISLISNLISVPLIGVLYPVLIFTILFNKIAFIGPIAKEVSVDLMDFFIYINTMLSDIPMSYIDFQESSIYITISMYIFLIALYGIYEKYRLKENFNDLQGFTRQY